MTKITNVYYYNYDRISTNSVIVLYYVFHPHVLIFNKILSIVS